MTSDTTSHSGKAEQSAEPKIQLPKRTTLTKVLPTDRISFEGQVELLRAFPAVYASNNGQPVTNDQAGEVITKKLSGSTVTQVNGFFCDVGILSRAEKGSGFIPSTEAIEYNNACQWSESEARLKLRPVFEKTWFYRCLVPRLQLAAQPQATCLALLANESKALPEHNEKLLNLLKFLELAGIVSTAGGTISLLQNKPLAVVPQEENVAELIAKGKIPKVFSINEENSFYLDKSRERQVTLNCPFSISQAEYDRICNWIKATWIIESENKGE